jgi:glycerol 2-dehydrogenase (NADP+)
VSSRPAQHLENRKAPFSRQRHVPEAPILDLQRSAGNHAVTRMLAGRPLQRFTDPDTKKIVTLDDIPELDERSVRRYIRMLDGKLLDVSGPEEKALRETAGKFGPGAGAQVFGTDFPEDVKGPARVEVLIRALEAGYRTFDTAEAYGSIDTLEEAAKTLGIPFDSLTIIYKPAGSTLGQLTGPSETKVPKDLQLKLEQPIPGIKPVLMLHELAKTMSETKRWLKHLMSSGGVCPAIGVSNVDLVSLTELYLFATNELKCPLEFVQNPFSPYDQDTPVREFCLSKKITYMGYGLFGGDATGFCTTEVALPSRHLKALKDPRFVHLANQCSMPAADLLLAWANCKGVTIVIYSGGHASENYATLKIKLDEKIVHEIDALFVSGPTKSDASMKDPKLQSVYGAVEDPTAWMVLDVLAGDSQSKALLISLVEIGEVKSGECLKHMILRIMRLVTHLQKAQDMKEVKSLPWPQQLVKMFAFAQEMGAAARVFEWTQTPYMKVGSAYEAIPEFEATVTGEQFREEKPKSMPQPTSGATLTDTGENFKGRFVTNLSLDEKDPGRDSVKAVKVGDTVEVYGETALERWKIRSIDERRVEYELVG